MKKMLLLMLLAGAIAMFAACGGNGDAPPPAPAGQQGQVTGDAAADDTEAVVPHVVEMGDALVLPLTTEDVTFTVWGNEAGAFSAGLDRLSDSPWYQELMRRTGITVEWIHPPVGGDQENLNLLIFSGDLPDVVNISGAGGGGMIPGGMAQGIVDGFIVDITEMAERYAPYYWELIHADEDRRREVFTDLGLLPGFWQVNIDLQPPWFGLMTRQDWLDDLGLEMPVTFDDWHHALSLFRDEKGATAPMLLRNTGFHLFHAFHAAFDFTEGFFQIDGRVTHGTLEPGFRDYVTMMAEWYAEGLIDPDFSGRAFFFGPQDLTTTGISGLFPDMYVMIPVLNMVAGDPDYRAVAIPPPVRYVGQTVHLGQRAGHAGFIMLVTNNNHDPILWTRLMNYLYSPEGMLFANWGIEGEHFVFGPDGFPQFTPFMYDNPDGWSLHNVQRRYTRGPIGGFGYDWRRELTPGIEPDVLAAPYIWATNVDYAFMLPPITLTPEEGVENARIMTDVDTHRDEMVARFITGAEPLENFDNFVQTLRNMGIERAIELQQNALDRFNAR